MITTRVTGTLAALALAGLLAACGSDGSGDSDDVASASDDDSNEQAQGDEADADEELLDWVECMRDEGVDIPDPTRDADGRLVLNDHVAIGGDERTSTTGGDDAGDEPSFSPEEMEAAEAVCGTPPGVGPGDISNEDMQAIQDHALEFAQCMRDEGIEDFPDPDFSDMGPGGDPQQGSFPAGDGGGDGGDGGGDGGDGGPDEKAGLLFPEIDLDDPETAAAFEACEDLTGGLPGALPDAGDAPSD
jgi:hypothetical protein